MPPFIILFFNFCFIKVKTGKNNIVIIFKNYIVINSCWNSGNKCSYSYENNRPEIAFLKLSNLEDKDSIFKNVTPIIGFKSSLYFENYFSNIKYTCPSVFEETNYKLTNNSKIAIMQIYDKSNEDFGILSQHSVETYCKHNNYDYYAFRKPDEKYTFAQMRCRNISELLPNYDYVVYLGIDIVITNNNYKLESITKLSSKPILLCSDRNPNNYVNSAVFFVKNCPTSKKILENLNNNYSNKPNDTFRKHLLLSIQSNKNDFHIFNKPIFNAHPDIWNSNDLLLNTVDFSPEVKCNIMKKILKMN